VKILKIDFEKAFEYLLKKKIKIGVLYIDGPHDYRSQLISLEKYKKLLSINSVIIVDDANYYHVRKATQDFLNNNSCWYASSCGYIQVIKTQYGTGTKSTKLKTFIHCLISICQNIILTVGSTYKLSFDVTSLPYLKTAIGYAYLNNNQLLISESDL
jgi:hypothetical protein